MSKICNINFWIGNDPPPLLELFQKFIRFGSAALPLSSQDISRPLSVPFIFRASGKGTDTAILTAKQAQLYFYILLKIFRRELMVYFSDIYFKWPQFCPHGIFIFCQRFISILGWSSNIKHFEN